MNNLDLLLEEAISENNVDYKEPGEKVMLEAENEFNGYSDEQRSRQEEKDIIILKIKKLRRDLCKYKNIKNHRLTFLNKQRADKRKIIRKQIEEFKLKLKDISYEQQGSHISSKDLINNSCKNK